MTEPDRELHTREEAAAAANMEPEQIDRIWRAAGLPNAGPGVPYYSDFDVENLRGFAVGVELFGEEAVFRFTRVMGISLSRIADAAVTMAVANLSGPMEQAGADEEMLEVAATRAAAALDLVPSVMEGLFPHHVDIATRRLVLSRPQGALRTVSLAVAFLDLVGFTERSGGLTPEELAMAVADFETLAGDVITAHGARLVKMIGDEVMYVATDAVVAAEIALGLRDAIAGHTVLAGLRGGLVFGDVVTQDGDYYGPEVNLAARIVACGAPGQILASGAVADALAAQATLTTRAEGERTVRGFEHPIAVFAVERSSGGREL